MSRVRLFPDRANIGPELVVMHVDAANEAINRSGKFTLALTGGSAATELYPSLAEAPIDWEKTHIFFGDERCVPPDHADSNYRLAQEVFLSRIRIPEANVHRIHGELSPTDAARAYEVELLTNTDGGALDLVHLGMGPDGHICSLFPGHPLLGEKDKLVASLTDSPKPPASRVTLTLPALAKARATMFLVLGASKSEAFGEAATNPDCPLPAALVHRMEHATWLVDLEASTMFLAKAVKLPPPPGDEA